jgi:hypothetical protein
LILGSEVGVDATLYIAAPLIGVLADWMYFGSIIHIIHGYLVSERRYTYREFLTIRLLGTASSSIIIVYAARHGSLAMAMVGAAIFVASHLCIYVDMFLRRRRDTKSGAR